MTCTPNDEEHILFKLDDDDDDDDDIPVRSQGYIEDGIYKQLSV